MWGPWAAGRRVLMVSSGIEIRWTVTRIPLRTFDISYQLPVNHSPLYESHCTALHSQIWNRDSETPDWRHFPNPFASTGRSWEILGDPGRSWEASSRSSCSFSPVVDFLEPRLRFPASVVGARGTPNVTLTYAQSILDFHITFSCVVVLKCIKTLNDFKWRGLVRTGTKSISPLAERHRWLLMWTHHLWASVDQWWSTLAKYPKPTDQKILPL